MIKTHLKLTNCNKNENEDKRDSKWHEVIDDREITYEIGKKGSELDFDTIYTHVVKGGKVHGE